MATETKKTASEITQDKLNSLRDKQRELQIELFSLQKQIEILEAVLRESK